MTTWRPGLAVSLLLLTACATTPARPTGSGGVLSEEQAAYDVRHYRLEIAVDPETRTIHGRLRMYADLVADTEAV